MTKKEREAAVERGLKSVQLRPKDESKFRRPPKTLASAGRSFFARPVQEDEKKYLPPTPRGQREVDKTKGEIPPSDRQGQVNFPESESTPLAPLQWRVLTVLREIDGTGEVLSYRDIADRAKGKREGVKSAMAVLRTVGAFAGFAIIQTAKAASNSRDYRAATQELLAAFR